jgi:hypothetical protein
MAKSFLALPADPLPRLTLEAATGPCRSGADAEWQEWPESLQRAFEAAQGNGDAYQLPQIADPIHLKSIS